jgi:urease accessory protein
MRPTDEADRDRIFAANRAVGCIALDAVARDGLTTRARVREEGSLRVRFPGPKSAELEAVIVNTAGGVAGGDRLDLSFAAGPGARLLVTTAAAEKVYRSLGADAAIHIRLDVGAGGALAWLPQETILFDRGRVSRTIEVDLAEDARLILAEAAIFGRAGMGEGVAQGRFIDRWRVRRSGRLLFADAVRLDGAVATMLEAPAVAHGGVAVATLLLVPGGAGTVDSVRSLCESFRGEVGISAWNGFAVARFCAADGAGLRHDLVCVLTALRAGSLPRLWLN